MKHPQYKQSIWGAAVFAMAILFLPIHHQAADFAEGGPLPLSTEEIEELLVPQPAWAGEFAEELGEEEARLEIAIGDTRYPVQTDGPQKSGWTGTKWTNEVVYYTFNPNVNATNKARFVAATAEWAAVADLTFVEGTGSGNYIYVQDDTGNSSAVGMIGGQQILKMISWSWKFIICHEIAHALGQRHEQSRSDRDTFVTINTQNIQAGKEHNFNKSATTNYGAYDFGSVMHYGATAFGINGAITIQTKPGYTQWQNVMGQRTSLSALDTAGMASRYGAHNGTVDLTNYDSNPKTATPSPVEQGKPVTITHSIANFGTGEAEPFVVKYYLSTNTIISTADTLIGQYTWAAHAPNIWRSYALNYNVPSSQNPGTYYVGWIIDANGTEAETNENNNVSYVTTPITVVLGDDNYEENDTYTTATNLSNNKNQWLNTINGYGRQKDDDWYQISVPSNLRRVLIDCQFTHADGDIDIRLYSSNGTSVVGASGSTTDNEAIDVVVPSSGTYYVKVYYDNAANDYNLKWNSIAPPFINLNDPSQSFTSTGGSYSIGVTSNASWTWSDNASWVTSSEASPQSGNETFSYSVAANTSLVPRSATVTFVTAAPHSTSVTHTISQAGIPPAVPSGLTVTQQGGSSIELSWGPSANATGYEVWRGDVDNPGLMTKIASNVQGTSYSDFGVDTGDRFYYSVTAVGANGSSGHGSTAQGILYGRPDSMVKAKRLLGNNRYGSYGGQTAVHKTTRAITSKFELWLENDSFSGSETFKTRSGRGNSKFKVVYVSKSGQGNVTSAITRGILNTQIFAGTSARVQVKVKPTSRQRNKKGKLTLAASTSFLNYPSAYDRGKMILNKAK